MATPESITIGIDISTAYDPIYWGNFLSATLLGIPLAQSWSYLLNNNDGWILRSTVGIVVVLNLVITILQILFMRDNLLVNYGDIMNIPITTTGSMVRYILLQLVTIMTQMFFASRVWLLYKKDRITPVIICILAVAGFILGTLGTVINLQNRHYLEVVSQPSYKRISISCRFCYLVCDIIVTGALSWHLRSATTLTISRRSTAVLQKLMMFVIGRGVLVTGTVFTSVVLFMWNQDGLTWIILDSTYAQIYAMTLLGMLNMRSGLRSQMGTVVTDSDMLQTGMTFKSNNPGVAVEMNSYTVHDSEMGHTLDKPGRL